MMICDFDGMITFSDDSMMVKVLVVNKSAIQPPCRSHLPARLQSTLLLALGAAKRDASS